MIAGFESDDRRDDPVRQTTLRALMKRARLGMECASAMMRRNSEDLVIRIEQRATNGRIGSCGANEATRLSNRCAEGFTYLLIL
ncbi:hypothetical protein AA0472_0615 [Acetobacter estunensis NRIC 0472]|nr:hypothetical protein AA0472_0615 [Acetobacter estunensis NRIC 0472]